ncbi:MAG: glycerol dehydrogenase, partial [Oscillibacter sp.]
MARILKSPAKYVQGPGILREFDRYLQGMGQKLLILLSENGVKRMGETLERSMCGGPVTAEQEIFRGECCQGEIDRVAALAKAQSATAIVGIGGGKILDTAKAAAFQAGLPCVIVPTVASTDSPCSSLSVIYRENGEFDRYLFLDRCPDMVLVDTEIIAKAPAALLIAGMGDAMATWFEARACRASGKNNQVGGSPACSATALARLCWEVLQADGPAALSAVSQGISIPALENIVEVNTYLSGVGFESGGLAAAHALQKGLTLIPALHRTYHGNKVAFCTLAQLVLEQVPREELEQLLTFCRAVGLPVCLADLGWSSVDHTLLRLAAEKA